VNAVGWRVNDRLGCGKRRGGVAEIGGTRTVFSDEEYKKRRYDHS
jgi:hypothetical protein